METVSYGSLGAYVEALQLALYRAGFLTQQSEIDGSFGINTQNAVLRFQRVYGLVPDGIVGVKTWNQLIPFLTGYTTHTIASGDTFYKIAKRYGSTAAAIAIANPDVNPYNLVIGRSLVVPFLIPVVSALVPLNSMLCAFYIDGLSKRYPFLRTSMIGQSVLGRPLWRLRLGQGPVKIAYNAAHHANEWITALVVLRYMENLAKSFAYGDLIAERSAQEILTRSTIDFIPLVNPDGVDLVTGLIAPGSKPYQTAQILANNYPAIPFPAGWKANIAGTDLNLNYPASWELARDIKYAQGFTQPGPRDFVGPYPLSEPESRAMVNITNQNGYQLTLSYHTQGEVIFWKYDDLNPPRSLEIGKRLAAVSGYALEETPPESANAGYKDWFILNFNKPGYTVEAGLGVNPLPLSQFERIYRANEPLMTEAAWLGTEK
ncbi:MAG: peptidoglycan-binding protein [Clostridia bacterium]|nr:peptidoglycan-binding protein [Clostridia bacterium]